MARLDGIKKSDNYHNTHFFLELESKFFTEYDSFMKYKKEFWRNRSRINWLSERYANTKFFHTCIINRRRKNRITFLKNNQREWTHDQKVVQGQLLSFFNILYSTDHTYTTPINQSSTLFGPILSDIMSSTMDTDIRDSEIITSLKSFKPTKAPGPDDLHNLFYQEFWDIVGE